MKNCKCQMYRAMLMLVLAAAPAGCHDERMNFLLIVVDDLRPALGAYGDAKAHSPNIDRLARQSVLFERAYAQQALCAPSRNSFLTSRRADTIGLYDFYSYWRQVAGNFTTLPEHLKNNGYVTSTFGKVFHPGKSCNYSDDSPYSWSEVPFHPYTEKYKEAPVCSQHNSTPATNLICPVRVAAMPNATLPDIETLQAAKQFLRKPRGPFFMAVGFQKPHVPLKYPKKYLKYHPLKKFDLPSNYEWPKNVSSVAYNPWTDLRRRSDVRKLGLDCPWEKIPGKFAKKIIQSYYAAVTYIDDLVGELLEELDNLKVRHKTIVILTSDHGWSLGEHALWSKYSNFEVAVRVPLIFSIPRCTFKWHDNSTLHSVVGPILKTPFQCKHAHEALKYHDDPRIVNEPVELLDIFPTIAELAGFPVPKCPRQNSSHAIRPQLCAEGLSLVPLILNKAAPNNRIAISQYPRPGLQPSCEPSSDKPRLKHITVMGYTIRTIEYRYTVWVNFSHLTKMPDWQSVLAEELYDHNVDSAESYNLANVPIFHRIKKTLKLTLIERLK